ncbi:MAG TPA: hypothetical protein VLL48_07300, partial [Longimicrobiales bacterium]|nr:hypothetical protein [Longimicrobiales bacterium]
MPGLAPTFRPAATVPALAAAAALALLAPSGATAQDVGLDELDALEFRHIGPVGNRVISAAGVAGDP